MLHSPFSSIFIFNRNNFLKKNHKGGKKIQKHTSVSLRLKEKFPKVFLDENAVDLEEGNQSRKQEQEPTNKF